MSGGCEHCGEHPVDIVRDVLDLAAVVLAGGSPAEFQRILEQLLLTPRASLQLMTFLLQLVTKDMSDGGALEHVRGLSVLWSLRAVESSL